MKKSINNWFNFIKIELKTKRLYTINLKLRYNLREKVELNLEMYVWGGGGVKRSMI